MTIFTTRNLLRLTRGTLLTIAAVMPGVSLAQTVSVSGFHFESICRSDSAANKNKVTVVLHGPDDQMEDGTYFQNHTPLEGATVNVLWTYVDYRQNHAVFKYRQDSCITDVNVSCTFNGGNGRARWQLSEVVGFDMSSPAFDTDPDEACPNSLMIDFW